MSNDIVWAKWGSYRWWPAQVLAPANIPDNVERLRHSDGEFAIKFLGSGDYNWINHGRTFFYEEGDSGKIPNVSNSKGMDDAFRRGLLEAEELFTKVKETKRSREQTGLLSSLGSKVKGGNKPSHYVKIKTNKPFGNCPVYTVEPGELQPCDCRRGKNPCDEESNCVNRLLMLECHPSVCPAAEECKNMRFQKREYPRLECFRTIGSGWGLRSTQVIKKGAFIIEYVGELITMDEYRSRMAANQLSGEENYYYLTIDSHRMIDAGPKGNLARFMNHSCDPNCITQKWTVNGDTRVGLFAIKDVQPGTELTFNYQFETVGDNKKQCMCGASNCSGLIGEKPKNREMKLKNEDKKLKLSGKKNKNKKKKKSSSSSTPVIQSKSPSPAPEIITLEDDVEESPGSRLRHEKIIEEFCFRCGEVGTLLFNTLINKIMNYVQVGNLLPCDRELCPKAYHPLCVGKDAWPGDKWLCPWHWCAGQGCEDRGAVVAWCRHCPTAYCQHHAQAITLHPVLGNICDQHDDEDLEFLIQTVREHGLDDNLPCPSPDPEQMTVWRRARGMTAAAADHETPEVSRLACHQRRLNRFSVDTPDHGAVTSPSPVSMMSDDITLQERNIRLQDTLDQIASESESAIEISEDQEPPQHVVNKLPPPVVKKKSPLKESWQVAQAEFRCEQEFSWRCNQPGCRAVNLDDVVKMRRHLTFHTLPHTLIHTLARDTATMDQNLQKVVRTVYKGSMNEVVGSGPRSLVSTGESLSDEFTCHAMEECSMTFISESELLDHLRQFHPPIVKKEQLTSPQKLEVGGRGWRCQHSGCGHVVTCVPGSLQLAHHWSQSHPDSSLSLLRYLDLERGQLVDIVQVYGHAAQCGACGHIVTSLDSASQLEDLMTLHWSEARHQGEVELTTLAYKSSPVKRSVRRSLINTEDKTLTEDDPLKLTGPFKCEECELEISSINNVFRHVSMIHTNSSITSMAVTHIKTGRTFINTALIKYVVTCGVSGCNKFAGRSNSLSSAIKKLREHWPLDHADMSIDDFCYQDVGIVHDDTSDDNSMDTNNDNVDDEGMMTDESLVFNDDPINDTDFNPKQQVKKSHTPAKTPVKMSTELVQVEKHALFEVGYAGVTCCISDCSATVKDITAHIMKNHQELPVHRLMFKDTSGRSLNVINFYKNILQCNLCNILRCSVRDSARPVHDKMLLHMRTDHGAEYQKNDGIEGLYSEIIKTNEHGTFIISSIINSLRFDQRVKIPSLLKNTPTTAKKVITTPISAKTSQSSIKNYTVKTPDKMTPVSRVRRSLDLDDLPRVMQDLELVPHPNLKLATFTNAHQYLNIAKKKELEPTVGLLKCCLCDAGEYTENKHITMHYKKQHSHEMHKFQVQDMGSGKILRVHEMFKMVGMCPHCNHVTYENNSEFLLKKRMLEHMRKEGHGENEEFYIILPGVPVANKPHRTITEPVIEPVEFTIATYDSSRKDLTFCKKGYQGPYHCMSVNCDEVVENSQQSTQKNLLKHWVDNHGDVTKMFYFDQSSNTVLNLKVLFNNVGVCGKAGCGKVLYGSMKCDFKSSVSNHWKNDHPELATSINKDINMVSVISNVKHISDEEATSLINNLSLFTNSLKRSKKELGFLSSEDTDVTEDDDEDDDEEPFEFDGPYKCSKCEYQLPFSVTSSRNLFKHWTKVHRLHPRDLSFIDQASGCVMKAEHLFSMIGQCQVEDCEYWITSNETEKSMLRRAQRHWSSSHPDLEQGSEQQMMKIILSRDKSKVVCCYKSCSHQISRNVKGWRHECLRHFLTNHDDTVDKLQFTDDDGNLMKIQHLFSEVGQCNTDDCLCIKVTNSKKEGALADLFKHHYLDQHQQDQVSFTHLVEHGQVKFSGEKTASLVESGDIRDNLECVKCCKPIKRNQFFNHWNTQHTTEHITSFTLRSRVSGQVTSISSLYADIGQCRVCRQFYGAGTHYHPLKRVAMEHYRREHGEEAEYDENKHCLIVKQSNNTSKPRSLDTSSAAVRAVQRKRSLEVSSAVKTPGSGLVTCTVCHKLQQLSTVSIIQHWSKHGKHPASLRVLSHPDNKTLNIKQLFQWIFQCDAPGCSTWVGSNISDKDAISKVRDHWTRAHNTSCTPKSSLVQSLGYSCGEADCADLIHDTDQVADHYRDKHSSVSSIDKMFLIQNESGARISIKNMYKYITSCTGHAPCSSFFVSNVSKSHVDRELRQHVDTCHSDVSRLSSADDHVSGSGAQYQCMAGADDEDGKQCPTLIPGWLIMNIMKSLQ